MKTLYTCLALVLLCVACSKPSSVADQPFILTATIKDIMDSMVEPSADEIWDAVATVSNAAGVVDLQPRTDEEWTAVRRRAITLIEATNLIAIEGRHVAKPGEKARVEAIELPPEEIESASTKTGNNSLRSRTRCTRRHFPRFRPSKPETRTNYSKPDKPSTKPAKTAT